MKLKKAYAYANIEAVVRFTIRDEVGDRDKAYEEGRKWWEFELTVYGENVRIVFEWGLWDLAESVEDEAYELLKRLGVEWDREKIDENSYDIREVSLYKADKRVAKLSWTLEPLLG